LRNLICRCPDWLAGRAAENLEIRPGRRMSHRSWPRCEKKRKKGGKKLQVGVEQIFRGSSKISKSQKARSAIEGVHGKIESRGWYRGAGEFGRSTGKKVERRSGRQAFGGRDGMLKGQRTKEKTGRGQLIRMQQKG